MNKLNLSGIPKSVWVRILGLFLVLLNQVLITFFDFQLLPFTDDQIYEGVSTVLTIVVSVITTYKDTPVTTAGQIGHEKTKELKGE